MNTLVSIFFYSLVVAGCCAHKTFDGKHKYGNSAKHHPSVKDSFLIKSITLQDSTYIIMASKNDSLFKIVSPQLEPLFKPLFLKKNSDLCTKIVVNSYYTLKIKSVFEFQFGVIEATDNRVSHRAMALHLKGTQYNGSLITMDEKSHYDIYASENLRGLCYLSPDSLQVKRVDAATKIAN